jgi:hypothetical protein
MKKAMGKKQLNDIEKIKNFLTKLGFVCSSYPSAQQLIYSKNGEIVIIKNNKS